MLLSLKVERQRLINSEQLNVNENIAYVEVLTCGHVTENNMSKCLCRPAYEWENSPYGTNPM